MTAALVLDFAGATREQYDEIVERMQLGGHMAPGGQVHVAGSHAGGWRVIDVWDSLEAFERFRDDQIVPHVQAVGLAPPRVQTVDVDDEMTDDGRSAAFVQYLILPGLDRAAFRALHDEVVPGGERPEGIKIASFFITAIILVSLVSRAVRSTELRITGILFDTEAEALIDDSSGQTIRVVARSFQPGLRNGWDAADAEIRYLHNLDSHVPLVFFEVDRSDASEFEDRLTVHGRKIGEHSVLFAESPVVANAIAALLIELERKTGNVPHAYFRWTEGNPVANIIRYIFFGEGDTAPLTHEVLRRAVEDPKRRPIVHVG